VLVLGMLGGCLGLVWRIAWWRLVRTGRLNRAPNLTLSKPRVEKRRKNEYNEYTKVISSDLETVINEKKHRKNNLSSYFITFIDAKFDINGCDC